MKQVRLKHFILVFTVSALLAFPQNTIGCGPMMDPHDYFVSFFSRSTVSKPGNQPFFYTSLLNFYDDWTEQEDSAYLNTLIIEEWQQFAGATALRNDVVTAVYHTKSSEMKLLQTALRQPNTILPSAIKNNTMLQALLRNQQQAAIDYLYLAKSIEPFCTQPLEWSDAPARDSIKINGFIKLAQQGWQQASHPFFKYKYAFLRCKLAFYNNRWQDCIRWYNEGFSNPTNAAVQPMALSYKAGALFRTGKGKEAALSFSKTFAHTPAAQKKSVFLGFLWATDRCNPALIEAYSSMASTPKEKAQLIAMFGLFGLQSHLNIIEKTFEWDANNELLPLLVQREVNKIEEKYLSPKLNKQPGSKVFYLSWEDENDTALITDLQVQKSLNQFEKMAKQVDIQNRDIYAAAAAYLSYMLGDANRTQSNITLANSFQPSVAISDQLQLIQLLQQSKLISNLNATEESNLLPSLQWLQKKAVSNWEYGIFYRNYLSQVLAPIYYRQGEQHKTVLALGKADMAVSADSSSYIFYGNTTNAIAYLQSNINSEQAEKLYGFMQNDAGTAYDAFLLQQNAITTSQVVDVLATANMREENFAKAVEWRSKLKKQTALTTEIYNYKTNKTTRININPFHDYINDNQRYQNAAPVAYTQLSFAQKMLSLQQQLDTIKQWEAKAKLYYQLASGFYNMSYYGNNWMAVDYQRSGVFWNEGNYNSNWQKEYFGVYKAKEYYWKAYELSSNKELKAAAYFLAAKCGQRQIPRPAENWEQYDQWEKDLKQFQRLFHHNPLFAGFRKEFGGTQFYQRAYNRCSYLRDFVNRR